MTPRGITGAPMASSGYSKGAPMAPRAAQGSANDIKGLFEGSANDIMNPFKGNANDIKQMVKRSANHIMGSFQGSANHIKDLPPSTSRGHLHPHGPSRIPSYSPLTHTFKSEFPGKSCSLIYRLAAPAYPTNMQCPPCEIATHPASPSSCHSTVSPDSIQHAQCGTTSSQLTC